MRDKQNYHPDIHKFFTDSSRLYNNYQLRVNKIFVKRTKKKCVYKFCIITIMHTMMHLVIC